AWYIMRPVLLAFINPRLGKFNVTAKGGVIDEEYFDWKLARPYIILLLLNIAGFVLAVLHLISVESLATGVAVTLLINLAWTLYNVVIAGASVAVASETRQVRSDPRVASDMPATVSLSDGRTIACRTSDFSQNGVGLILPEGVALPIG